MAERSSELEIAKARSVAEKYEDNPALASEVTGDETEHIKAQIEETRSNMGETIDAIQDRLSFSNISEQVSEQVNNAIETAKDAVYDATIGKGVSFMRQAGNQISHASIVRSVRENPLPFILIGAGAGLLAYNSLGSKQNKSLTFDRQIGDKSFDRHLDGNTKHSEPFDSKQSLLASAQHAVGGMKDSVSNVASAAYEGVANAASSTYSGAGDMANAAYGKAGELGTAAQETYSRYLDEKPWAIGVVALAAGAAVGFAIPSTRYEGKLMGDARVNLIAKAQDTAGEFVEKAKDVAAEAANTIKEEVRVATQ